MDWKVLVADDDRDCADSLALLLQYDALDVLVCYDGAAALQLILEQRPAVALLDIGMPAVDGYAIAREVRQRIPREHIRLIAVTGWGARHDKSRALAAGFDELFVKPFDPAEVTQCITRLRAADRNGEASQPPG